MTLSHLHAVNSLLNFPVQGHADTCAQLLLLRLADAGHVAAVVRVSNALIEFDHIRAAAAIASAFQAQQCRLHELCSEFRSCQNIQRPLGVSV